MSAEENKALDRRFTEEGRNQRNLAVVGELMSGDYNSHDPVIPAGSETFKISERRPPMRRKFRVLATSVLVFLAAFFAFVPVPALAATSQTVTFHNVTMPISLTDFCTGLALTGTVTINGVEHSNTSPSGTSNDQFTGTGDVVLTRADGVTFTGHATLWDDEVVTAGGAAVFTFTGNAVFVGSDGSTLHEHVNFSMTITPAGAITSVVVNIVCH